MDTNFFFSRDSEAALGSQSGTMGGLFWSRIRLGKAVAGPGVRGQSATMGGSFWSRIRLGKAVAGPGVRGQDDRDKCVCVSALLLVRGSAAGAAALK